MSNHRPKSLNELNQVYDKAMKAQRAIKAGSMSLSEQTPPEEKPSENIFDQLREQADQTKKPELYDSDIADIANDFIKRFTQPEKSESRPAPRELKRPAPSIQSLYHTPVKAAEADGNEGVALKMDQTPSEEAVSAPVSIAAKPHAPEKALPDPFAAFAAAQQAQAEEPAQAEKTDYQLQQEAEESAEERREATERAQHEAYSAPRQVAPTVHITSSERSSLMDEYLRVMSDEDDDTIYKKAKKFSLFGRKKKHQEEPVEESYDSFTADDTPVEEDEQDVPVVSFDSSSVRLVDDEAEAEYPAEEDEFSEELPMNLYDYIEADFDDGEESDEASSSDIPLSETFENAPEEPADVPQAEEELSYEDIIAEDFPDDEDLTEEAAAEEIIEEAVTEEIVPQEEETAEDISDDNDTVEDISEEIEIPEEAPLEESSEEAEEFSAPAQSESSAAEYEEEIVTPTEEAPEEDSPTAGMVFDDVFSVSDENMRSYTGGDWTSPSQTESGDEPDEEEEEEAEIPAPEKAKKRGKVRKKRKPVITALLSLILVVLVAATALVTAIGGFIGVDTGKLFGDSYRAFSAEQNFSLSGVYAGDLIVTQDYSNYDADGDSFVYVNYDTKEFMVGKYKGYTYDISGDVLYIAENEAGRILVAREDTLGAVTETYSDIGAVAGLISENYIIIDAVLLALCLVVIILLILPLFRRGSEQTSTDKVQEEHATTEESEETQQTNEAEEAETEDDDDDDDDGDFDFDYDTDNIEEGLFSGI